MTLKLGSLVSC